MIFMSEKPNTKKIYEGEITICMDEFDYYLVSIGDDDLTEDLENDWENKKVRITIEEIEYIVNNIK